MKRFSNLLCLLLCIIIAVSVAGCKKDEAVSEASSAVSSDTSPAKPEIDKSKVSSLSVYESVYSGALCYTIDASSSEYGADKTGQTNAAGAIQKALDEAAFTHNGGTVFLPAGKYRIDQRLYMRDGVTLLGEYADPDGVTNGDYGTVIEVYSDYRFDDKTSAVQMCASSAIEGITFYYPEQSIDDIQDYYYTIDTRSCSGFTIKNCTFLNSYCGIALAVDNGAVTGLGNIENIKGTVLKTGIISLRDADIHNYDNIIFSPRYWANAGKEHSAPAEIKIRSAMKSLESVGLYGRDIDRSSYTNITLDGFYYGFYGDTMKVAGWAGGFYRITVKNAVVGMKLLGVDTRYGMNMSLCDISGSEAAVVNLTQTTGNTTDGNYPYVSLCGCKVSGKIEGFVSQTDGADEINTDIYPHEFALPENKTVYNAVLDFKADCTGTTDASSDIQAALDSARQNGGGIVYIPGGDYIINSPLTVYSNTALLGAYRQSAFSSTYGSRLLINYAAGLGESAAAAVTVLGENAGINGFQIICPDSAPTDENYADFSDDSAYAVECTASNNYVFNIVMTSVGRGIKLTNADGFVVSHITGTVWNNAVTAENSDNGIICRMHTNVTYFTNLQSIDGRFRSWMSQEHKLNKSDTKASNAVTYLLDGFCGRTLTLMNLTDCNGVQAVSCFFYGGNKYCVISGGSVKNINGEAGRLFSSGKNYTLLNGASAVHINSYCRTYSNLTSSAEWSGSLRFYNLSVAHEMNKNFERS